MAIALCLVAAGICPMPALASGTASPWPPKMIADSGNELVLRGNFQFDLERHGARSGAATALANVDAWRRRELGLSWRMRSGFGVQLGYDFNTRSAAQVTGWTDNFIRYGAPKLGEFRIGQFKTPVGWDAALSSSASTFLETALPAQTANMGRRIGIDWNSQLGQHWRMQSAWYQGGDLNGDNDGHGPALRLVWNPLAAATAKDGAAAIDVVHLGLALSREERSASRNGRGQWLAPIARFRVRPEAGLTALRLVDTGSLRDPGAIDRIGLEAAWLHGPWLLQSEVLRFSAQPTGKPRFDGDGWYLSGAWTLTGESRSYRNGAIGSLQPRGELGALELALRLSHVDLDDGPVHGGTQTDWTFGANWYVTKFFKLQANHVWVRSERAGIRSHPRILELRAQFAF